MKAKDYVLSKYPNAFAHKLVDIPRQQMSIVIIKGKPHIDIFTNEGAKTENQAWDNAKNELIK